MDYLRGIAIIWVLCILALPPMALGCIWEEIEKRRDRKYKQLIERRRREFAEDIEQCGQRMRNSDCISELLHKGKQTIKYTGLFSGEETERKLNYESISCV